MPRGRHAKPSATAKAAAPVAAAIGTLVTVAPPTASPPAGPVSTTKTLGIASLIQHTAQRAYTVRPRETLISIAQRFYGNPMNWHQIYQANTFDISDPGLIYPGQKLTIPGATRHRLLRDIPRLRLGGGGRPRRRVAPSA